jgi:hypothetical protein
MIRNVMRRGVFGVALAALLGCGSDGRLYGPEDNPTAVRDVTGVEFGWSCDARGCQVTLLPATPPPDLCSDPTASAYSFGWGRFVEICSVCLAREEGIYWSTTPGQCRILACDTDAQCPALYQATPESDYACINGLCQNADTGRFPRDVLQKLHAQQLCFAVHPRADTAEPFSATTQEVLVSVNIACPGADPTAPCTLPAGCRMP